MRARAAAQIARYLTEVASRVFTLTLEERTVNGQPCLVGQQDGITTTVLAFDITGDQITRIWAIRNRDKLPPWTTR